MNENEALQRFVELYGAEPLLIRCDFVSGDGDWSLAADVAMALALAGLYVRPMRTASAWIARIPPHSEHDWKQDGYFVDRDDEISRLENDQQSVTKAYRRAL